MYFFIDNVDYKFFTTDSLALISSHVNYGHSTNLEFNPDAIKFGFGGKPSVALDLGGTYEFFPITDVRTKTQSQRDWLKREYRYKIGLSIQDLGWITYLKPPNARDFTAEVNNNINLNSFNTSGATPLASADDTLRKKFTMIDNDTKFRMNLPTLISAQGDIYAGHNIYLNSTVNYAFQLKNNEDKIHEVTTLSITPRWDWRWLGLYVPFSFDKFSHFRLGVSTRIGPLIVGMADILPFISKRDVYGMDFHFLLKVPHIYFKKKTGIGKSKFEGNKEKTKKRKKQKKGETNMPTKDVSPVEKQNQTGNNKDHTAPAVNQDKQTHKHFFPSLFRSKKKRKARISDEEHTIYYKM